MKKSYFFMGLFFLGTLASFAQNRQAFTVGDPDENIETPDSKANNDPDYGKNINRISKAFGDTLFYEDFNGALPQGWSIVNNNPNNFQWRWDTIYQQGQFSMTRNAIKSTTAANGFMSLPSDFYNTPTPTSGRVNMDTYIESDTIFITPKSSVWVSYQQYVRYCCSSANRLVLQVSTDNFNTFTEFDAINGLAVNAGNTSDAVGGMTNVINISTAVANQPQFKIRFLAVHSGRYFWMIDDFAVIEGVENDLELTDPYMEFHEANFTYYPFYGQIPYDLFPPLPFFGRIYNNGSNTQTNVQLEVDVTHTAFPGGAPGQGLVYSTSMLTNPPNMVSGSISDSTVSVLTGNPRFVPTILGDFQVDFLANSDSLDGNLGNETAIASFSTTDTIFARDDNLFGGGTGPASYVRNNQPGGTVAGDRFGTMYIIDSRTGGGGPTKVPTSITYYVTNDTRNIGVEIIPKIWAYNEDSLRINGANFSVDRAFDNEIASSFVPYTVTAADTNSFITLPLDNGDAVFNGFNNVIQVVVGWEVNSIAGGTTFEVANDATSAALQSSVTTFNYHGHSPGWGWVSVNPVIRLNMGNLPVSTGIDKNASSSLGFEVIPNPNNGLFKVEAFSKEQKAYNLSVRNMLGQNVYNEIVQVNGNFTKNLDLSGFEKGVYFVSLEHESERIIKKVVIQ